MEESPIIYSKETLIEKLKEICGMGWVKSIRAGKNDGAVGNTLEDLLGIEENNLPLPNAAEWEIKSHRIRSNALSTKFHMEPSPRAMKWVPNILLPNFGWPHKEAGKRYPETEMSLRLTMNTAKRTDRGFMIQIDWEEQKFMLSFDSSKTDRNLHENWLREVESNIGLGELNPQPYWGFNDVYHKAAKKLLNTFLVGADHKSVDGWQYFEYKQVLMLKDFSKELFIKAIKEDKIKIEIDARTGHNHGAKFRMSKKTWPLLYNEVTKII